MCQIAKNLDLMQAGCRINLPGEGGWGYVAVAGLTENKANSANPAELELGLSWAELGNNSYKTVKHNIYITFLSSALATSNWDTLKFSFQ